MEKTLKFLWFFLFFTITSYAIQEIRLFGFPIPFIILLILLPLLFLENYKFKKSYIFNFSLISFILLSFFINIIFESEVDYTIRQLIYPISTLIIANYLNIKYLKICLIGLYLSSIAILIYGIYGFITWKVGDPIQHAFGYFGITYLESTRNGDLIYLFPGLFISFIFIYNSRGSFLKIINLLIFFVFLFAVIANQSRGGFIVILFSALYLILNKNNYLTPLTYRIKSFIFLLSISFFIFFISYFDNRSLQIIAERFLTIFSTNDNRVYTYNSNSERIDILLFSFYTFLDNIFGIGITGLSKRTNGNLFHAENAYISILVYYGFIGLSFFIAIYNQIYKNIKRLPIQFNNIILRLIYFFLVIYSLFNLMIDLLPFWILLGLVSINYKIKKKYDN